MENFQLFEAAQLAQANNAPDSRWIKAQLGRVLIKKLNVLTGTPMEEVISGDPTKEIDNCIINCWTPLETAYFEQNNKYHILQGNIVPYNKQVVVPTSANTITDDEIKEVLEKKFMAVRSLLNKLDSAVAVERVLRLAREMNKPVATITAIEARLSELQEAEYSEK